MTASAIIGRSLEALAAALRDGSLSSTEVVGAYLERAAFYEDLGAFITLDREGALAAAEAADRARAAGAELGPLHGVPIALKDMIPTRDLRTTAGSEVLADWVPPADAAVVATLRAAGAVIQGKTHTTEFSVWATGGHPRYRTPRNPWDATRVPGGSSTGSAIAVAAGLTPAALGTDTGGSVRIPAAVCGVVGLKPSRGTISSDGVIPLSRSLDHVGILARGVRDVAAVLAAVRRDGRTAAAPTRTDLRGARIGVLELDAAPDAEVAVALRAAESVLARLGAVLDPVSVPALADAPELSSAIQYPELLDYHRVGLDRRPEAYGTELRSGCAVGATITPDGHTRAHARAKDLARAVDEALVVHDALLLPAVGLGASPIGQDEVDFDGRRQSVDAVLSEYTRAFNLTGHPAISVPCGRTVEGLPIGLQLVGRAGRDDALLEIAHAYEQASRWHLDLPVQPAPVPPHPPTGSTSCST
jgi:aspartyl-tRNA(Asn)/glutamyl-tRNA(Gln) amidotransferase subunit A